MPFMPDFVWPHAATLGKDAFEGSSRPLDQIFTQPITSAVSRSTKPKIFISLSNPSKSTGAPCLTLSDLPFDANPHDLISREAGGTRAAYNGAPKRVGLGVGVLSAAA